MRLLLAALTLVVVSVIVFASTQLLPGNAAKAKLGKQATPESLAALEKQLGLDHSALHQYLHFVGGLLRGDPGNSLTSGQPIMDDLTSRLSNSAFLVLVAAAISIPLSLLIGSLAAVRRDGVLDEISSFLQRVLASIPEFVIGLALIALFATSVFQIFPAVSIIPPGSPPWANLDAIWLPALTLVARGHPEHRADHARGDDRGSRVRLHRDGAAHRRPRAAHRAAARAAQCARRRPSRSSR